MARYAPWMRTPRSILISGASSGIGAALARLYATPGVRLALGGRDIQRLDAVADACRSTGASVVSTRVDVTDAVATTEWVEAADDTAPLDLVIANAGISGGTFGGGENHGQATAIFATNVGGVVNTVHPAAERMRRRGRGQIALMGSLAGFRGLPGAPSYSASKAAVRAYADALRGRLRREGVTVSLICPGFIRTPMTDMNGFPMPFLLEVEDAAHRIRRGLAGGQSRIAFPWPLYTAVRLAALLPPALSDPLFGRMPEKR